MLAATTLSAQGPTFSRLVAGVMTWGVWGHNLNTKAIAELIDTCLEVGITTFDHADIYGHYTTEAAFGAALAGSDSLRSKMQLVSKCGIKLVCKERSDNEIKSYDLRKAYIIASAEQSLRNLGTDYLDLLLVHRPSPLMQADEVAEAIAQLKSQGKVIHFGVSNFTPSQFNYLNSVTPLVTNQVKASLLHTEPLFDGTFDQCLQHRIHPMAWSPLGALFSRTDEVAIRTKAKLAEIGAHYGQPGADILLLAWLLHHPSGILPVLGTARPERMRSVAKALEIKLSDADWFELLEASLGHEVA